MYIIEGQKTHRQISSLSAYEVWLALSAGGRPTGWYSQSEIDFETSLNNVL